MKILDLLGMHFDAAVLFVTFIQIGSGHAVYCTKQPIISIIMGLYNFFDLTYFKTKVASNIIKKDIVKIQTNPFLNLDSDLSDLTREN